MGLDNFNQMEKKISRLKVKMTNFRLENMQKIVKSMQIKTSTLNTIHVTGSNGKGSATAFISSILVQAGYRVGAYISPHVESITERIQVNGREIPKKDFARIAQKIFVHLKRHGLDASYFEFLTIMAFIYFIEKKVDFVVAEVGLGGRLDATNVLEGKVNVFTSISLEHTETLGDTVEKIAAEKAGIIKQGSVTIIGKNNVGLKTIRTIARQKKSRLVVVQEKTLPSTINGNAFEITSPQKTGLFRTSMIGFHQPKNASLAVQACFELKKIGHHISVDSIKKGLFLAKNKGRLEVTQKKPLIVFDCAHNEDGFNALAKSLKIFTYERLFLVFACMKDKDYKKMFSRIKFDHLIVTKVKEKRSLDPTEIKKIHPQAKTFSSPCRALEHAKKNAKPNDMILVAGSIYLVGEAFKCTK